LIETPPSMAEAPEVGPLPAVAPPTATRFSLASGLEVTALRRDVAPIVSAAFMFRSGAACDPAGKAGLASMTAEMLDEGAGPRDALAIAAELEQLGADLWLGSGRDGSQLSVQAPRETFHAAMAIAADILTRPRLEDADWQRVHNDRRTSVVQRRDQPEAVVNVASDRLLFGDAHPYGEPVDGLERSIDAITLDDVRAFHAAHYRPNHASLVVAGDIDGAALPGELEALLAAWKPGPTPPAPRPLPWPERPRLVIIHRQARPRASSGWSRPASIASRQTDPRCRC
jgi:predicted Zn-dependent peptidase